MINGFKTKIWEQDHSPSVFVVGFEDVNNHNPGKKLAPVLDSPQYLIIPHCARPDSSGKLREEKFQICCAGLCAVSCDL